ncbi:MAG: YybS family protein [Syntrophaceae bacterium]|nr:YybS family protein [Syntrophaceae bacterium]
MFAGFLWTTLVYLAAFFLPFAGSFLIPLMPLPVLYHYLLKGRRQGLIILALSWSIVFGALLLAGAESSMPLFLLTGLAGVVLGELLGRSLSLEKVVLYPVLVFFTTGCLVFIVHGLLTGQAPFAVLEAYVAAGIQDNLRVYGMLSLSPEQIQDIRDQLPELIRFFSSVVPAFAIVMATLVLWLNVLAGGFLIRQQGGAYPDFGDLTLWKAPERTVWFLIAAGGALLVPADPVRQVGLNVLILCLFVYLFQGLAIAACFFERKRIPLFFRYLFYGLVFAQQYVALTLAVLGLLDLWADLRKYIGERGGPS